MAEATFAAGCFWGVEQAFSGLTGVTSTSVGYAGGHFENPTYEDVCGGATGHAEVVRVAYDPNRITYDELLDVFWDSHDPAQLNRQGFDVGTQYRSAIFYHDAEQEAAARSSKATQRESGAHRGEVVTEISAVGPFWLAEDYHQQYLAKRRGGGFLARLFGR